MNLVLELTIFVWRVKSSNYEPSCLHAPVCFTRFFMDLTYNVCFIKILSKLSSVLLLCLLRIFMRQTLCKKIDEISRENTGNNVQK